MQELALLVVEKRPAAQAAQVRSLEAVPDAVTYCPATQVDHEEHELALLVLLKVPATQAVQLRLVVASGVFET